MNAAPYTATEAIPVRNLERLQTQLQDAKRRAARNALEAPTVSFGPEREVEMTQTYVVDGEPRFQRVRTMVRDVTVTANVIRVVGWRPVATLSFERPGDPTVWTWPGEECPQRFRTAANACDHCGTSRARKRVFVLRSTKDGQYRAIGTSCVRDYCGIDPQDILRQQSFLDVLDSSLSDAADLVDEGGNPPPEIVPYLAAVCALSREIGWTSARRARETGDEPTWRLAVQYLDNPTIQARMPVTEADWQQAETAVTTASTYPCGGSDYVHNLRTIARGGVLYSNRERALIASLPAYEAARQERARRAAAGGPGHFGRVGSRVCVEVRCESQQTFDGQYGRSVLHRLVTSQGHRLIWWASGNGRLDPAAGWQLVRATIAAHERFRGEPQTKLTRCVVVR